MEQYDVLWSNIQHFDQFFPKPDLNGWDEA